MGILMVRIHQKCYEVARVQISSRLVIRNPVKMTPVLDPGVGSSVVVGENGRWVGDQDDFGDGPGRLQS